MGNGIITMIGTNRSLFIFPQGDTLIFGKNKVLHYASSNETVIYQGDTQIAGPLPI
jgi:hypothetical protein